jgi:Fuc2NAc and GlcNAc transferase
MREELVLATLSFCLSLTITEIVRRYAVRHSVIDRPNERSSHTNPTPRGGGLGILVATLVAGAIGSATGAILWRDSLTLGVGMALLGSIGWLDDARSLQPRTRFTFQVIAAIWTLWRFGGLPDLRLGETVLHLGPWGYLVGVVGIVWSINLFNFMDGIDGLAGSQATLIFGTAALLLFSMDNGSMGAIALILATGSLGFLIWNWPPARIFLGDAGSGALGYLAAGMAIGSENERSVPLLVFGILGGVFVLDATLTLARRLARGKNAAHAHRDHAYQRLATAWGHHWVVSAAAALVTAVLATLGILGALRPSLLLPATLAAYSLLLALFVAAERRAPM